MALALAIGGWAGQVVGAATADPPPPQHIRQADAELLPQGGVPVRRRLNLARDTWDRLFPGRGGQAVYRFTVPSSSQPKALWFSRVGNQALVEVDGVPVAHWGTLGDAAFDSAKVGRLVALPASPPSAAPQRAVQVTVTAQALRRGGLGPVQHGELQALALHHEADQRVRAMAPAAYALCLALMGGLAAWLWRSQRDPLYGTFSLLALFGIPRNLDPLWPEPPLPWPWWGGLMAVAFALHLGLIARFVLLMADRPSRWPMRAIGMAMAGVPLLAALSFIGGWPLLWTLGLAVYAVIGLWCFGLLLRTGLRPGRVAARLMLAAGTAVLVIGIRDLLLIRLDLGPTSSDALLQHAVFGLVLLMAALIAHRHNRSAQELAALSHQLAQRVADREAQLRDAFEALRAQQQEQAVLSERQRIMRELHDGVGSQLVGLLNLAHGPSLDARQVQEHTKLALDEMRMAIDALQPLHDDLVTVLATLRYRLQGRLDAAGVRVVWEVDELPAWPDLSAQAVLQLQRLLLEAFTNVLKHARADEVRVQTRWRTEPQDTFELAIVDNGVGLPTHDGPRAGHGLRNMKARAVSIGATLSVATAGPQGGVKVLLEWPLASPARSMPVP